jgi:hypothetical protein
MRRTRRVDSTAASPAQSGESETLVINDVTIVELRTTGGAPLGVAYIDDKTGRFFQLRPATKDEAQRFLSACNDCEISMASSIDYPTTLAAQFKLWREGFRAGVEARPL